jgi:hypothetical protein
METPRLFFKLAELANESGKTEYELIQAAAAEALVLSVWFDNGFLLTCDEDHHYYVESGFPPGLFQLPASFALQFFVKDTVQVSALLSLNGERVFPHVISEEERFSYPTGKEEWRRGYIKSPEYSRKDLLVTLKEAERFRKEYPMSPEESTRPQENSAGSPQYEAERKRKISRGMAKIIEAMGGGVSRSKVYRMDLALTPKFLHRGGKTKLWGYDDELGRVPERYANHMKRKKRKTKESE